MAKQFNPEKYERKFREKTVENKMKAEIKERVEKKVLNKPTEKDLRQKKIKEIRRANIERLAPTSARTIVRKVPTYRKSRMIGRGALSLVSAFGVQMPSAAAANPYKLGKGQGQKYLHAGRPVGSGKYQKAYGVGVNEYKKLQNKQDFVRKLQAMQEAKRLQSAGYNQQQIQEIQVKQAISQPQIQQAPIQTPQQANQSEMEFERMIAEQSISPHTMDILQRVKDIHNMGQRADIRQQRVHRERAMVAEATNLLSTPSIFKKNPAIEANYLDVDDPHAILKAPNIFIARPDNHIIRTNRPNIIQTGIMGNNLNFFGTPNIVDTKLPVVNSQETKKETKPPIRLKFF